MNVYLAAFNGDLPIIRLTAGPNCFLWVVGLEQLLNAVAEDRTTAVVTTSGPGQHHRCPRYVGYGWLPDWGLGTVCIDNNKFGKQF